MDQEINSNYLYLRTFYSLTAEYRALESALEHANQTQPESMDVNADMEWEYTGLEFTGVRQNVMMGVPLQAVDAETEMNTPPAYSEPAEHKIIGKRILVEKPELNPHLGFRTLSLEVEKDLGSNEIGGIEIERAPRKGHRKSRYGTESVPLIAHYNEYLMHAVLGLSASHLSLLTGTSHHCTALHHRTLAIRGSNAAISLPHRSASDGDALLAACYALAFQSSYMEDGLNEYFQIVRGCSLVTNQLRAENLELAFLGGERDHFQLMKEKLRDLPLVNPVLAEGAERSLGLLERGVILQEGAEIRFWGLLMDLVVAIKGSSLHTYFRFLCIYMFISKLPSAIFNTFLSPTNIVARLLIAHFLALEIIISPILDREWSQRNMDMPARTHLDWIPRIYGELAEAGRLARNVIKWVWIHYPAPELNKESKVKMNPNHASKNQAFWHPSPQGALNPSPTANQLLTHDVSSAELLACLASSQKWQMRRYATWVGTKRLGVGNSSILGLWEERKI
ncbi:hypothetical protein B7494_g5864 [Chlorociboria aeruginascens]|nr:hypothetical protein B7494_g5864 [Chlorociboria aeruginascens]